MTAFIQIREKWFVQPFAPYSSDFGPFPAQEISVHNVIYVLFTSEDLFQYWFILFIPIPLSLFKILDFSDVDESLLIWTTICVKINHLLSPCHDCAYSTQPLLCVRNLTYKIFLHVETTAYFWSLFSKDIPLGDGPEKDQDCAPRKSCLYKEKC